MAQSCCVGPFTEHLHHHWDKALTSLQERGSHVAYHSNVFHVCPQSQQQALIGYGLDDAHYHSTQRPSKYSSMVTRIPGIEAKLKNNWRITYVTCSIPPASFLCQNEIPYCPCRTCPRPLEQYCAKGLLMHDHADCSCPRKILITVKDEEIGFYVVPYRTRRAVVALPSRRF
jgi:hypothetical protein